MVYPWQIYFYLIPNPVFYEETIVTCWKKDNIIPSIEQYFRNDLWKSDEIREDFILYGDREKNYIDIFLKTDKTCEIKFTLDLRNLSENFLKRIIEFSLYKDAYFLLPCEKIVKPSLKALLDIIINSEASDFCMYIEPTLKACRDEFNPAEKYFWENYIPESKKKKTIPDVEKYIKEFIKNINK